ncbi:hypothetical protein PRBRB14_22010 [Hallella multisaccharivorax DSM 17128]|uniref:Uncharacterized protein n=1 Tax=Hallella multisaccharivorax DSM 17128 TaxID=688246 RepID=F8N7H8_9BACT|nr:DUF6804 family protein [Hallella multisaccharivorax]EGN57438.1 hypothetical protein Premu_2044 [Hallella multisaccharivorax DSM 17128]GJG31322.1 hypothetical protein PRBRB14_22010 [Hallella multisaccharivorax DSM 17128]
MSPIIKLVIAILLILCLFDMPYGFYALVRFAAMAAFAYLSYQNFKIKQDGKGFLFAVLAVLFQPFFKVELGRTIWNMVDVAIAVWLFYIIVKGLKK